MPFSILFYLLVSPDLMLMPLNEWHRTLLINADKSTLVKVMAWCRQAPSHYLNQCWLISNQVLWHLPKTISHEVLKIWIVIFSRGQWVNPRNCNHHDGIDILGIPQGSHFPHTHRHKLRHHNIPIPALNLTSLLPLVPTSTLSLWPLS